MRLSLHMQKLFAAIDADDYPFDGAVESPFTIAARAPKGSVVHRLASATAQCLGCKKKGFISAIDWRPIVSGGDPQCPDCGSTKLVVIDEHEGSQ